MVTTGEMSVRDAGRKGGQKVRDLYGKEYYQVLGRKGGRAVAEKLGREHYCRIGKQGGQAVKAKLGTSFYSEIGKLGGRALLAKRGREYFHEIGKKRGRPLGDRPVEVKRSGVAPRAKVTVEDVMAIRARGAQSDFYADIGRDYGLTKLSVFNIIHRKTWRWVD